MNVVLIIAAVFLGWLGLSVLAALAWGRVCALNDGVGIGEPDLEEADV